MQAARRAGPCGRSHLSSCACMSTSSAWSLRGMKVWGYAWLRFGDVDVRCTALVRRWTSDAVGVEVPVDDGEKLQCWIWQGACDRLEERTDAWV